MNVHLGPSGGGVGGGETKKAMEFDHDSWIWGATKRGEESILSIASALASFLFMAALAVVMLSLPQKHLVAIAWENGEKEEKESPACLLHIIWALGVSLLHLESKAEGFFWISIYLHHSAYFKVSSYNEFMLRDPEVKKKPQ